MLKVDQPARKKFKNRGSCAVRRKVSWPRFIKHNTDNIKFANEIDNAVYRKDSSNEALAFSTPLNSSSRLRPGERIENNPQKVKQKKFIIELSNFKEAWLVQC